jgi:transposase-like protein
MVKKEDVEQLMLQHFPSCPLCKAKNGYEVSGIFKNYVRCKSCKAQWMSNDFVTCKELNVLKLWKTPRDGRGKSFKQKEHPVTFWQRMMHARDEEEFLEKRTLLDELFEKIKTKDSETRNEALNRLRTMGQPVFTRLNEMLNISDKRTRTIKRYHALELLQLIADEKGMDLLIPALQQDQDPHIFITSTEGMKQMGFRTQVAYSLGVLEQKNKTGKAVESLIWSLKNDVHPNVRAFIAMQVFANSQFPVFSKDPKVIEALNQALTDAEPTIIRDPASLEAARKGFLGPTVANIVRQALSRISIVSAR